MYQYKGDASVIGIPGVPARDLTDEEAEDYGVTESPLYVPKESAPAMKRRASSTGEETIP